LLSIFDKNVLILKTTGKKYSSLYRKYVLLFKIKEGGIVKMKI